MNIVDLSSKETFANKLRYSDQIEILLDMLIASGKSNPMEVGFTIPLDDVVIILELTIKRLIEMLLDIAIVNCRANLTDEAFRNSYYNVAMVFE
jgi:hypothetical protein